MISNVMKRNISSIKCPKDLEEMGIVTELNDISLGN